MSRRPSDAALIRRTRRGDDAAYEALWRRHASTAERAVDALGGDRADLIRVRAHLLRLLRRPHVGGGAVDALVLRVTGELFAVTARPVSVSPTFAAYIALRRPHREALWHLAVERAGTAELAAALGTSRRGAARRARRAERALIRGWVSQTRRRGVPAACVRHRRRELLRLRSTRNGSTSTGSLTTGHHRRARDHSRECAPCALAAAAAGGMLDQLGVLLAAAELGAAGARYRRPLAAPDAAGPGPDAAGPGPDAADRTDLPSGLPLAGVRFTGLPADLLPPAGWIRSTVLVTDADGFDYTFAPVSVRREQMLTLLREIAAEV